MTEIKEATPDLVERLLAYLGRADDVQMTHDAASALTAAQARIAELEAIAHDWEIANIRLKDLTDRLATAERERDEVTQRAKWADDQLLKTHKELRAAETERDEALKQLAFKETLQRQLDAVDERLAWAGTGHGRVSRVEELLAAERERDEFEKQVEALMQKLEALAPHGTCGCSYDRPGDVCAHHSPSLAAAERDRDRWHDVAMKAGVIVCRDGGLIYSHKERLAAAGRERDEARAALEFYATEWLAGPPGLPTTKLMFDRGEIARNALSRPASPVLGGDQTGATEAHLYALKIGAAALEQANPEAAKGIRNVMEWLEGAPVRHDPWKGCLGGHSKAGEPCPGCGTTGLEACPLLPPFSDDPEVVEASRRARANYLGGDQTLPSEPTSSALGNSDNDHTAGRVPTEPGSRADAPDPSVPALTGFDPSRTLIFEALRFAVWSAGQGISPDDGEPARSPEDFLFEYSIATGDEEWDTLAEHFARVRDRSGEADETEGLGLQGESPVPEGQTPSPSDPVGAKE